MPVFWNALRPEAQDLRPNPQFTGIRTIFQESEKDCKLWARTFYSRGTAILAVICFQFTPYEQT